MGKPRTRVVNPLRSAFTHPSINTPRKSQLVTSCANLTPHRSGRWWARLVLNSSHVGLNKDAVEAGNAGLKHINVRAGESALMHRHHMGSQLHVALACMQESD